MKFLRNFFYKIWYINVYEEILIDIVDTRSKHGRIKKAKNTILMGQVAIIMKNEFKLCPKCNRFVNSNDVVPQKGKTKRKKSIWKN